MIYTQLEAIKTTIEGMGYYKKTELGSNFVWNRSNAPIAVVKLEDGNLAHHTRFSGVVSIIGLLYKEKDVEKETLSAMESMVVTLRNGHPELSHNDFNFYIDQNVLDVFNVDFPVMAPFGAYRLQYRMRQDLQTNT